MFYDHSLLNFKTGKFALIWMVANDRLNYKLKRDEYFKEVLSINISNVCKDLIRYICAEVPPGGDNKNRPRFSLYLSSMLMYGVVKVHRHQLSSLLDELSLSHSRLLRTYQLDDIDISSVPLHKITLPESFLSASADSHLLGHPQRPLADDFARNPNMAPLEAITMREAEVTSDAELQYGTGFGEELVPGLPRFEEFLRVGDIDELQRQQMPALTHVAADPPPHDQRLSDLQLPAALPPPQISCAVDLLQLGAEWDQSCSQVEPDQSLHKEVGDNAPGNKLKRRMTSSDQSESSAGGSRPKLSTPTSPIQLPSVLSGADLSVDPVSNAVEELLLPPIVEVAGPSDVTTMPPPADIPPSCRSPVVGQSEPVQTVDVLETNTLSDSCLLPSTRGAPAVTPSITGPPDAQHPPPVVSRRVPPVADVTIQEELEQQQQQRQFSFELPSQVTPPLRLPRSRRLRIDAHTEISRDVTRDRIQSMATDTMRAMSATEDNILPPSQRIVPALSLLSSSTRHLSSVLNRLHSRHCVVQQADYFDWSQDSADDVEKQRLAQSNQLTTSSNIPSCLKRSDEASALSVTTINQTANQTLGVIPECGDGDAAVAIDNVTLLAPANPAIAEELEELPVDPQLLERVDGQVDVGSGGQAVLDNVEHPPVADVVPSENLTSAQSDASSSDIYRHSLVPDCLLSHDSSPLDGPLLFSSLCDTSSCSRRQAAATFSHLLHLHAVGRLHLQQTQCYAPISITSLPSVS